MASESELRYWTWEDLQRFLVDNALIIAIGTGENDELALTGKGAELAEFLMVALAMGGDPER